jgi:hypothetical protein
MPIILAMWEAEIEDHSSGQQEQLVRPHRDQ